MLIDGSIKTFARRSGRITEAQKRALDRYQTVPFSPVPLDFAALFGNSHPVFCEIGFGMGEATAEIAGRFPENNYLGIEVFSAGVGKLLSEIENQRLSNLKIISHDAVETLNVMIPDNAVSGFHIFFPDPWPKKRHHKRRLVRRPLTGLLAAKLIPGGYLYMATDWQPYAVWALSELEQTEMLINRFERYAPCAPWRPVTKFETRALKTGSAIYELYFERADGIVGGGVCTSELCENRSIVIARPAASTSMTTP